MRLRRRSSRLPLVGLLLLSFALLVPAAAQDVRTEVPPIASTRWTSSPPALPTAGVVTQADYFDFIFTTLGPQFAYYRPRAGDPSVGSQDICARREAFLYWLTGDETYAQRALTFIHGHYDYLTIGGGVGTQVGFNTICPALQTYLWIRTSPSLTEADHEFIHSWFNLFEDRGSATYEYGAMNRALGWATGRMILTKLWPSDLRNPERLAYATEVWNDWWTNRDTDENAEGYNGIFLTYLAFWLETMGQENLYNDARLKRLIYRYLAQVSPLGPIPYYGDCVGWNEDPGPWIALFEKWGNVYRDGRFKWAAHRLFEYTAAQQTEMWDWGNINIDTADALMLAYIYFDPGRNDRIPSDYRSMVTTRQKVHMNSRTDYNATGRAFLVLPQRTQDKVIFRNGWQPGSAYAQICLTPPLGHGHTDAAAIGCYISQGAVLLTDTPYLVKDEYYHNAFQVRPNPPPGRWVQDNYQPMQATVKEWKSWNEVTYCRLNVPNYLGRPVTLDRRLWFLGDSGMWVQDTIQSTEPYTATIGPAWQTLSTYGASGPNWVNTCYQTLPVAFIWQLQYMMQWTNRPWDLLVYFPAPPDGSALATDDVTWDTTRGIVAQDLMNNSKLRVALEKTTTLLPGQAERFSTLLLPHSPTDDATPLADGVTVLKSDNSVQILRFRDQMGMMVWVGINEGGKLRNVGGLVTDAKRFVIKKGPGPRVRWWMIQGTTIGLNGETFYSGPIRTNRSSPVT